MWNWGTGDGACDTLDCVFISQVITMRMNNNDCKAYPKYDHRIQLRTLVTTWLSKVHFLGMLYQ